MSLKHLAVPQRKEVLQEKWNDNGKSKAHRSQEKALSIARMKPFAQRKGLLDSNPKYRINNCLNQ